MQFKSFLLFFILILHCTKLPAQEAKPDTIKFYREMENYSKRSKLNRLLYRLVFRPIPTADVVKPSKKNPGKKVINKNYRTAEGKIIRNINIETLDPLGNSIIDSVHLSQNFLTKAGNKLHIKSHRATIRNLLLIHENQPFDSLRVKESERLIRSQSYVHDVAFSFAATSKNSDSVDIFIRELDNWSIIPKASGNPKSTEGDLSEKNFLGLGHEFQNIFTWYHTTGKYAYSTLYRVPNIKNSYITTTAQYSIDQYRNYTKTISVERPLFSPLAKWAGGVNFLNRFQKDSILYSDSVFVTRRFNILTQDYWAARAWQLFRGGSVDDRTTNLILSERLIRVHYNESPPEQFDSTNSFSDEVFYLSSLGITQQKYIQDKYIFNYGITEDVPVGFNYAITGGYHVKNSTGRLYGAIRLSFGNYHDWGYLSTNFEYGTFFHASDLEQGVFTVGMNYYTHIFEIGKWKFRQFAKPQLTIGLNRLPGETITINDENGIRGFGSPLSTWTRKVFLTLQTQSYAPWKVFGFRFGPYLISSLEMFGDAESGFNRSKLYSRFALGILIKNEYLVFNLLQLSIVFYPEIPGSGSNIIKFNSGWPREFGFRDFVIRKPTTVIFQ